LALEGQLLCREHAWSHKDFNARRFRLNSAAVKANDLSIVVDLFTGATVKFLK